MTWLTRPPTRADKEYPPHCESDVGGTAEDNRLFVEGLLYCYRAGFPWPDVPARFGDWKNMHLGSASLV
uniref:transposase n=1 Tax=Acetobacter senegalensis TaxID=446692 RepID=UPI0038672011